LARLHHFEKRTDLLLSGKKQPVLFPFAPENSDTGSNMLRSLVAAVTIAACMTGTAFAEMPIAARYLQARGDHVVWEIDIPSPPPAAVIVKQYILPGSEILASSHPPSSYDKEAGQAKWLIMPVSPGTLRMEMTVSKPIRQKGEIHGEVMFQDESQNTTASIFMRPAKTVKRKLEGC